MGLLYKAISDMFHFDCEAMMSSLCAKMTDGGSEVRQGRANHKRAFFLEVGDILEAHAIVSSSREIHACGRLVLVELAPISFQQYRMRSYFNLQSSSHCRNRLRRQSLNISSARFSNV